MKIINLNTNSNYSISDKKTNLNLSKKDKYNINLANDFINSLVSDKEFINNNQNNEHKSLADLKE